MRWNSWLRPKPVEAKVLAAPETSGVQRSLAFGVLHGLLAPDRKYNILELGPADPDNVAFFSHVPCKLWIEDLFHTLNSFDYLTPEDGFSYEAIFEYLLPFRRGLRFDVVLTWDLLNYLDRGESAHLMRHVTRFCHSGTLLLALIWNRTHIPDKPTRFKIKGHEDLSYEATSSVLRSCPRYQQADLKQLMPSFRIYNCFALGNGMKEYILVCD